MEESIPLNHMFAVKSVGFALQSILNEIELLSLLSHLSTPLSLQITPFLLFLSDAPVDSSRFREPKVRKLVYTHCYLFRYLISFPEQLSETFIMSHILQIWKPKLTKMIGLAQ